jgi:hypothetical protein
MKVESGDVGRFDGLPIGKENMDRMVGGLAVGMGRSDVDVVACAAAVDNTGGGRRTERMGWNQSSREREWQ